MLVSGKYIEAADKVDPGIQINPLGLFIERRYTRRSGFGLSEAVGRHLRKQRESLETVILIDLFYSGAGIHCFIFGD